ncbi:MAG: cyclase family protein [Proteobacteria bacterium]|nr:cyclase family protein [Pseudomonadota bacterium]MBU4470998.1 cyclase family protein [Pseudomonadota bacterium]MCG2753598.1 cyclase family protein [Desulfobacteraceae bacterium]
MRIIDLSTFIEPTSEIKIDYQDHRKGAERIRSMFGLPADLLRDEEGWAVEEILRLGTHSSTHIDAPWHYNSRIQGKKAQTIDELPMEWFFNDGVVLEMRHKEDGDAVTEEDVKKTLEGMGYTLKPLDIVLVRNGRDQFYGLPDYMARGCGVTAGATRWLYDQGIRVMGIDAWGWDRPLQKQAEDALSKKEKGIFWEAHQADIPYCQIERLVNLAPLPPSGFKVSCFPLKIKNGSAAPARVVAIL